MRLPVLLLIAVVPLGGCDIFIDNPGGEGMPCGEQNDCQKGLVCDPVEHLCRKSAQFGNECQGAQDCSGEFGACVCYPANGKCFCSRPCGNPDECNDIGTFCALVDPVMMQPYCTRGEWTYSEFGRLCKEQDTTCPAGPCVEFQPFPGRKICTRPSTPCPEGAELGEPRVSQAAVCGYPAWFGFWLACGVKADCEQSYPMYPECHQGSNCTRVCTNQNPCPQSLKCDPPGDGVCIPQ